MKPPLLSVVVPVHNVEDYLQECLDSLAGQSLDAIEVVLVDDGSTDGSGRIAREHAARDSRFRFVHQPNAGLSAARNTGVAHTTPASRIWRSPTATTSSSMTRTSGWWPPWSRPARTWRPATSGGSANRAGSRPGSTAG
ncbi:glycosyltransferase family 2 protein [Streptomyces sp. M10(2022)]